MPKSSIGRSIKMRRRRSRKGRRCSLLPAIPSFVVAALIFCAISSFVLVQAQPRGGQSSGRGRREEGGGPIDSSGDAADVNAADDPVAPVPVEEEPSGRGRGRGRQRDDRPGETGSESSEGEEGIVEEEVEGITIVPPDENTGDDEPVVEVMSGGAALALHNEYRSKHQVGSLGWSSGLEDSAMAWAVTLAADECSMYHSSDRSFGENLAIGHASIELAVQDWYDEVDAYDFDDPGFSSGTGHFTQIVWRDTDELGCATAVCPETGPTPGRLIHVCHYAPFGNVLGNFGENVLPPVAE
jgi:hypothetical protein